MQDQRGRKTTFLFWNICNKDLTEQIVNLVQRHQVDVLILAESAIDENTLVEAVDEGFHYLPDRNEKVTLFSKLEPRYLQPISDSHRYTIRLFNPPGYDEIILVCLHLRSKNHSEDHDQLQEAIMVSNEIRRVEEERGNSKIIITGDFNMNPFEKGMVARSGFNAVMTQELASKKKRKFAGFPYSLFYNPMWSLYGDLSRGVSGTYFYKNDDYGWQMFDQVLFHAKIISYVDFEALEIITTDGEADFLTASGRISDKYSDHLPVKFVLYL